MAAPEVGADARSRSPSLHGEPSAAKDDAELASAQPAAAADALAATATRVEAWGSLDGSAPSPIACEPLQVEPDTLTVLVLRPTRADAPPACARR